MPTYTPLQSIVLPNSQTSVTFSGIPQTYQDIVIVCNLKTVTSDSLVCRINGDASAIYSRTQIGGDGSTKQSTRGGSNTTGIMCAYGYADTSNFNAISIVNLNNYSDPNTKKNILTKNYNGGTGVSLFGTLWDRVGAVSSIEFRNDSGNAFATGCTFDLYGISTVSANNAQAFGGTEIYYDSSYVYHVFKGSGTFIPYRNLTCDYLVVAGGGGSDGDGPSGGGGAGGLRSTVTATGGGGSLESALSLTSGVSYTVTIGAGGVGGIFGGATSTNGSNSVFSTITSTGGGRGGGYVGANTGSTGGSGGGGAGGGSGNAGGSGTANQGYAGGAGITGDSSNRPAGGGGGAGAAGSNAVTNYGGNGGNGVSISAFAIATGTGVSNFYAGGGGGGAGSLSIAAGTGGSGGGGNGSKTGNGSSGVTNTGGGGGGALNSSNGGNGGSGIVIVRYAR
jgi:hypothetical protein